MSAREAIIELQTQIQDHNQVIIHLRQKIQLELRELKKEQLTLSELSTLDDSTSSFKAVGKTFIAISTTTIKKELSDKTIEREKEIKNLTQQAEYTQKKAKELENNLKDILRAIGAIKV
eukprot:TRINITY_DN2091_c0_g1_i1.p1 TRINITY_DN2091_c0_g1~~TRINITY_DN2091_c0_g1_i1.p1  ORF type:complete len:119 (+),score=70.76 TRINITY_DN2091_c0_g1_i1:109-465(+)